MYRQAQLEEDLPQIEREREKKNVNEVCGTEKQMLEFKAVPNKKKYVPVNIYVAWAPWQMPFQLFLREEAQRDIKISFPLFIYEALHLRSVWLDITASKLTTICVRQWSKVKFYNLPITTLQHLLSGKTSNRALYVAYFS